jgi:FeS assembly protein IscX
MELKWIDTLDIALDLMDAHPDVDPQYVRFTDLRQWVMTLENFNDNPEHSNEKILEAIQMMWIEEND